MRSWYTCVAMNCPRRLDEFMDFAIVSFELEDTALVVVGLSSLRWSVGSCFATDDEGFPSSTNVPPIEDVELVTAARDDWIAVGSSMTKF